MKDTKVKIFSEMGVFVMVTLLSIFVNTINMYAQSVLISQCKIPTEITDHVYGKCSNYERYESKGYWDYPVLHLFLDEGIGNLAAVLNDAKHLLSYRGTSCIHLTGNLNTSVDANDVIQATRNFKCVHLEGMVIRNADKMASKEKLILTNCSSDKDVTFNLSQSDLSTLRITGSTVKGGYVTYLIGVDDASRLDSVILSSVNIRGFPSFNKMSEFIYDACRFIPLRRSYLLRSHSMFSGWNQNLDEFRDMFTDSYGIFSRCQFRGLNHLNFHGSQLSFLGFDTCKFYKKTTLDISKSKIITLNVSKTEYRFSGQLILKGLNNAAELRKLELWSVEVHRMPNFGILQEFTIRDSIFTEFQERQSAIKRLLERNLTDEVPVTVGMSNAGKFLHNCFLHKIALNLRNSLLTNIQFRGCRFYEDLDLDVSNSRISILIIKKSMFFHGSRLIVRGLHSLNNLTVLRLDSVTIVDKPAMRNLKNFACDHCSFAPDLVLNFTESQIRNITLTNPILPHGSRLIVRGLQSLNNLTVLRLGSVNIMDKPALMNLEDFACDHCRFAPDLVLNFTKSKIRNITLTNPIFPTGSYVRLVGISECPLEQLTINGRVWVDDFSVAPRSVVMEDLRKIEIHNSIMGEIKIPTHGDYMIDLMDSNLSTLHVPSQEETKPILLIVGLNDHLTIKHSGPKLLIYMDMQSPDLYINMTITENYCSEFGNSYYGKKIKCSTELLDKNRSKISKSPTYTYKRIRHQEILTDDGSWDCDIKTQGVTCKNISQARWQLVSS